MSNINRKLRTRKALMDSALELVGEGQHFSSLSIREVAKRAGVVPNAFYRHFKSLDELGLALGDEVGLLLRQLMRQARLQGLAADRMISDSVDFFISHVVGNPTLFRFMSQSLTGGSEELRGAIRNELNFFATELVMDLNRLRILTHIEAIDLDMIGHLVVQAVSGTASEILDLPPQSDNLVKAIRQRTVKQVRLIFLGAVSWHSSDEEPEAMVSMAAAVVPPPAIDPQKTLVEHPKDVERAKRAAASEARKAAALAKDQERLKRAAGAKAAAKAKKSQSLKRAAEAKVTAKAKRAGEKAKAIERATVAAVAKEEAKAKRAAEKAEAVKRAAEGKAAAKTKRAQEKLEAQRNPLDESPTDDS